MENSLANVVMPDKLIMQKYWPVYEAVAKLKHKTAILKIKGV